MTKKAHSKQHRHLKFYRLRKRIYAYDGKDVRVLKADEKSTQLARYDSGVVQELGVPVVPDAQVRKLFRKGFNLKHG